MKIFISNQCKYCHIVMEALKLEKFEVLNVKPLMKIGGKDPINFIAFDKKENKNIVLNIEGVPALYDEKNNKTVLGLEILNYLRTNYREYLK